MQKKRLIIFFIIFLLSLFLYSNFYVINTIKGTYVNRNYQQKHFLSNIPYEADTLKLLDNNNFSSSYYGKGKYKIYYTITGTKIVLNYGQGIEEDSFDTSLEREFFLGNLKINLFKDLNQFYEKVD
ncbi:hypothetical protein B0A78_13640 [Flavobacterium columnare NBRC 100251 = ATCC 23463]|nr:hypothetical protein AWN65_09905 [Flavobacterium covae]AND63426.1 hypothetical protein AX766_02800 [Flavobacterium covae]PDS21799.1 hypothetical protein B0A78_13640 [Flavobacterium columnare NBRC 100251 = ATCC 23463]GEM59294.1 hypothetical protein FC1_25320 [Flavobacterium columnare NBRC 100251 = ATCC 23463]